MILIVKYDRLVAHPERLPRSTAARAPAAPKKKLSPGAWEEARALIWKHRVRLAIGLAIMIVNRLAGLVLPWTTKYLMDDVVMQHNWDLLPKLRRCWATVVIYLPFANCRSCVAQQRSPTCARKWKRMSCACPSVTD